MSTTAFVSSHAANRCCVKVTCALARQLRWEIRAVDLSHAFSHPANLNSRDRAIAIPPEMATLPWKGPPPPTHPPPDEHRRKLTSSTPARIFFPPTTVWRTRRTDAMALGPARTIKEAPIRQISDRCLCISKTGQRASTMR